MLQLHVSIEIATVMEVRKNVKCVSVRVNVKCAIVRRMADHSRQDRVIIINIRPSSRMEQEAGVTRAEQ